MVGLKSLISSLVARCKTIDHDLRFLLQPCQKEDSLDDDSPIARGCTVFYESNKCAMQANVA